MEKLSNSKMLLLKKAAGGAMWKSRYFVLLEDRLFYSKDRKCPSNANAYHQLDLKTVTKLDVRRDSTPMEIELTSRATAQGPEIRWKLRISDSLRSLETWTRRLYLNCEQLVDPEMQYLCSRKFYAKMISLSKAFEERKKARICAMWNSKTTVEGLIPIKER